MDLSRPGVFLFLDGVGAAASFELAAKIERLGYSALWVVETSGRDSITFCSHLLARTERLVIGSGVASIWARAAANMAAAAKTASELSAGRFVLGLGVNNPRSSQMRGLPYGKPLDAMRSYLATATAAFSAQAFGGSAPDFVAARPPVVIAALNDKMLEVAATAADGTITYFVPPEHTARARKILGDGPRLFAEQAVMLEASASKARTAIRQYMQVYLKTPAYQTMLARVGFSVDDWSNGGSDRLCDAIVAWG
ncbi:MAG: LLM class flavin-dependent oxidoreductase, partial [Stellaceae bacterium]